MARPTPTNKPLLRYKAIFLLGLCVQAILSCTLAWQSTGTYQDDELRHYLVARTAGHDWHKLLDIWGRPGFTIPFAPPACLGDMPTGFRACRLMTAIVMLLASLLTYLTARRMRAPCAWLTPWILLLMPLWTGLSYTPTTEMAAALYLIAGTWQLAAGHRRWAAAWFALLPLARHELIVLLVPVAVYFLLRRDLWPVIILAWGEVAWNLFARIGHTPLPIMRFFTPLDQGHLGSGSIMHYTQRWIEMAGLSGVLLTVAAFFLIITRGLPRTDRMWITSPTGRRIRMRIFVSGGAIGLVALQTILYRFNRFASGGYARFLIPIAPWMAISILYSLWFLTRRRQNAIVQWAGVALVVCLAALNIHRCMQDIHPYRILPHQTLVADTIREVHQEFPQTKIVGASPWVKYFQNDLMEEAEIEARDRWARNDPPGLIYLYDQSHATAVPLQWFTEFPHQLLMVRILPTDVTEPYLRVLRRRPN